eukprot:TRINITY_DN8066_c0_g1_i4.p1 TRINITY_DN8066_c0_g1~~TRINITY_DN8066_c0_g1_i4.p1  ORF type:complete len:110 (-),score=3.06 TRINITY_DN8066_c0_g1_i4:11-340(-)
MLYGCIFFWIADSNSVERARAAPISQRPLATTDTDNTVRPERSRPIPGCQPLSFHFFMVVAEPVSTSYYDTKVGQVTLQLGIGPNLLDCVLHPNIPHYRNMSSSLLSCV